MMACVEGVDSVTACEEFRPMAECAARIMADNGFQVAEYYEIRIRA
jgi:hypothetical protein